MDVGRLFESAVPSRGLSKAANHQRPALARLGSEAVKGVVLPDRIELSTSPLPMECSTTELRQQMLVKNRPPRGAYQAGRYLPQASPLCKLAGPAKLTKSTPLRAEIGRFAPKWMVLARFGFRKIPSQSGSWPRPRIRPNLAASLSRPTHTLLSSVYSMASCGRPCDGFDNDRREREETSA